MILRRAIPLGFAIIGSSVFAALPAAADQIAPLRDIQVKVAILTLPNDSVPAALAKSLAGHEPNGPGILQAAEVATLIKEVATLRGADLLLTIPAATVQEGQDGIVEVTHNFVLRGAGDVNGVVELGFHTSFSAALVPVREGLPAIDLNFHATYSDVRPNAQPPFTAESIAYLDLRAKPGTVPAGATAVFHLPRPGATNSVWFLVTPAPKQPPKPPPGPPK